MTKVQSAEERADPARESENAPNFVHELIEQDLREGRLQPGELHTRFPPEPNGYLHIGHAKAIVIDFGSARRFGGRCNLRFDDTNPTKEEQEFVDAMLRDIRWLGYAWDELHYASDHFEKLYAFAEQLIEADKAYVDESTPEEMKEARGDFYRAGRASRYRDRPPAESLALFRRMRAGEFPDGAMVLRAKIDLAAGNINLRDPAMYRILKATHHRTGDRWPIYPMYDFAHGQCDAIEGITHSLCTLEYEAHRPLYDWFIDQLGLGRPVPNPAASPDEGSTRWPRQIESAPLRLSYTVLSKRNLKRMVEQGIVAGWDDPRMPTLAGMRRRGYTPEAIVAFCERVGVSKRDSVVDLQLFEHMQREDLNARCERRMAVLRPLRLVIENYPEGESETFEAENHPEHPELGRRKVPFSRVVYVERDDFRMDAPKKWHRLAPGREVRLRYACLVTCKEVIRDTNGEVVELRCTWDPASRGGNAPDGRTVRGTLHWVSAEHAVDAEVLLYDRLFQSEDPTSAPEGQDFIANINPNSLEVLRGCKLEPSLAGAAAGTRYQFERMGYFCADTDSAGARWSRTVTLKDSWAKLEKKLAGAAE